jgi:LPS-assembly lipoprotein
MSWFDRTRALLAMFMVVSLSGCFQPLYSEAAHPGVAQAMKEIAVQEIPGRFGHYLADDLITQMNGTGETPPPKYRLQITAGDKPQQMTPTVESQIAFASSATLIENASIVLTSIEDGKVIFQGQATAIAPYDRSFDNYANLRASRDAELRLARSLADEIAQRVAAAISDPNDRHYGRKDKDKDKDKPKDPAS